MIELAAIIDGLSKAISLSEQVKEFFDKFEPKKKKIFIKYIEPTFEGLQPVIKSYADNIAAFRHRCHRGRNGFARSRSVPTFEPL
jgi:hypothetical protein